MGQPAQHPQDVLLPYGSYLVNFQGLPITPLPFCFDLVSSSQAYCHLLLNHCHSHLPGLHISSPQWLPCGAQVRSSFSTWHTRFLTIQAPLFSAAIFLAVLYPLPKLFNHSELLNSFYFLESHHALAHLWFFSHIFPLAQNTLSLSLSGFSLKSYFSLKFLLFFKIRLIAA